MNYQALICDVDGTLIENKRDGRPSVLVKQAISQIRNKVYFGVATGRPFLFASHIIEELDCTGPCILGNGVQIYDPVAKEVVVEHLLPEDNLTQIYQAVKDLDVVCTVQERENRVPFTKDYNPNKPLYIFVPIFPEEKTEVFLSAMDTNPNIVVHKMVAWEPGKTEYLITNPAATKQHGILEVARLLGISTKEIIGVGDGPNDFPLLMACGLKVAMGNAVDDLKAIADYVAPTVEEDGVAEVIEKFILKLR